MDLNIKFIEIREYFMKYKTLSSLYYQNKEEYLQEYEKKFGGTDTFLFPLYIHDYQSFIVPSWEIVGLVEEIGRYNTKAVQIFTKMPNVARKYYLRKCLIDEIQMTNDIEGVHSTRQEIHIALKPSTDDKIARFHGMAKKYEKLLSGDMLALPLKTSKDIRNLYDEIVNPEIALESKLDGELFRNNTVYVLSPTQQTKHEGVNPEKKIIEMMDNALNILNIEDIPVLVKIAIFHYFFGYIHPFYDGNGRISRFISSYLLNKNSYDLLALELSHTIKDNKKKYYKAFQVCNEKKNRGDITPFVIIFLEFIRDAAKRMYENLSEGYHKLLKYQAIIKNNLFKNDGKKINDKKKNLLSLFVQNSLFALEPFLVQEIVDLMKISRQSADALINVLTDSGYPIIKTKDGKWNRFLFDLDQFDDIIDQIDDTKKT